MKLPFIKRLNSSGVAHHALIAFFVVFAVAGVGAYRVWQSSAATLNSAYILTVNNEVGCKMSGRKWDAANNNCMTVCRPNADPYKTVIGADGNQKGFCAKAVAETISKEDCILTLHRYFLVDRGCATRVDGDNTNNAQQCLPGYPNYVAESGRDKCVAATIVTATPTTDPYDTTKCTILGRAYDTTNSACKRVCNTGAGSLLLGATSKQYFCDLAVQTNMSSTRCAELHRKWLTDGCARRPDQVDTNNAPQCESGYPYYNANFKAAGSTTPTDVCESSKTAAIASEAAGVPNSSTATTTTTTTGASGPTQTGSSETETVIDESPDTSDEVKDDIAQNSTCRKVRVTNGALDCLSDPVVTQAPDNASTLVVDSSINEKVCELLGRQWVPGAKQAKAGCSTQKCFKSGVTMKSSNGKEYCQGYVSQIKKEKCNELNRKWLSEVKGCALFYNQDRKKKTIVNAIQCEKPFTTYALHEKSEGRDECLKPKTVERIQGIAKSAGKPFTFVASLPPKGVCKLRGGMMWSHAKCIKKPTPVERNTAPEAQNSTENGSSVKNEPKFSTAALDKLRRCTNQSSYPNECYIDGDKKNGFLSTVDLRNNAEAVYTACVRYNTAQRGPDIASGSCNYLKP